MIRERYSPWSGWGEVSTVYALIEASSLACTLPSLGCGTVRWDSLKSSRHLHVILILHSKSIWKGQLVSWCFEPSQPQRIILGLTTNFNLSPSYSKWRLSNPPPTPSKNNNNNNKQQQHTHNPERTNNVEIRPEEQSEKAESCRKDLWDEIQLTKPRETEVNAKSSLKRSGQARLVSVNIIHKP